MNPSTTDRLSISVQRTGPSSWTVRVASIHGHSRTTVATYNARFTAPPRSLLDPAVGRAAGLALMHALEKMQALLDLEVDPGT